MKIELHQDRPDRYTAVDGRFVVTARDYYWQVVDTTGAAEPAQVLAFDNARAHIEDVLAREAEQ